MDWLPKLRQQYAVAVRPEWLEKVLTQLHAAHPDFSAWTEAQVFEKIITAFLFCDLNQVGAAALPLNTKEMHKVVLEGKFVLQVDEVVNMAAAARERYSDQAGNRCLKLALTDGCQRVVGVEHCHLPAITWDCPAGSKLLIHNVPIRRGLLLLGPDNTALLGGQVEWLEAARQRAVAAWTRPVVGRPANSGERDIFAEARQAAWAPGPPSGHHQQQQQPQQQQGGQPPAQHQMPPAGPPGPAAGPPAPPQQPGGPAVAQQGQQPPWQGPQLQHQQPWQRHAGGEAGPTAAGQQQQQRQLPRHTPGTGARRLEAAAPAQAAGAPPGGATALNGQGWQGPTAPHQYQRPQQHPPQRQAQGGAAAAGELYGTPSADAADGGTWLGRGRLDQGPGAPVDGGDGYRAAAEPGGGGVGPPGRLANSGSDPIGGGGDAVMAGRGLPTTAAAAGFTGRVAVDLVMSSDSIASGSGSGGSSRSTSLDDANPALGPHRQGPPLPPQQPHPHLQQEQHPQRQQQQRSARRLGPALLGSVTVGAPAGGPQPTTSSGLLPPRPALAPRSSTFSPAINASGVTGTGPSHQVAGGPGSTLRKPVLPLARSSPAHSGLSAGGAAAAGGGGGGVGRRIFPSPGPAAGHGGLASTAGHGAGVAEADGEGEVRSEPRRPGGAPANSSVGLGQGRGLVTGREVGVGGRGWVGGSWGPPSEEVDVVDLASLDDDDGCGGGGGSGGGKEEEEMCGGGDGAFGRSGKRPRVEVMAATDGEAGQDHGDDELVYGDEGDDVMHDGEGYEHGDGHDGDDGTAAAATAARGVSAHAGGVGAAVPVQMDVGTEGLGGSDLAGGGDAKHHHHHRTQQIPAPPHQDRQLSLTGPEPLASGPLNGRGQQQAGRQHHQQQHATAVPGPRDDRDSGEELSAAEAPGPHLLLQGGDGGTTAHDHAGMIQLCHVPDLLSDESDAPIAFPLTVDVYGLFHELDGDTAYIEDGTAMVSAQLTDTALAPLLVTEAPPPGFADGASLGLEEIQTMADSTDPVVQAYGQELAARVMSFIKDFAGIIRLEYAGPPPSQPRIIWLRNDGESDEGGASGSGGAESGALQVLAATGPGATSYDGQRDGSGGCGMYEQYVRELLGYDPNEHMQQ